MAKARGRCLPMNFTLDDAATGILKERARIGSSLADVDPMNIDNKVKGCGIKECLAELVVVFKQHILFSVVFIGFNFLFA